MKTPLTNKRPNTIEELAEAFDVLATMCHQMREELTELALQKQLRACEERVSKLEQWECGLCKGIGFVTRAIPMPGKTPPFRFEQEQCERCKGVGRKKP